MLSSKVVRCSKAAAALGIREGIEGAEALRLFKQGTPKSRL